MYVLQGVIFECVLAHFVDLTMNPSFYRMVFTPLISAMIVVVCYEISSLIGKNKLLNRIFFGK